MHRKSGNSVSPVDQAAISELDAANRAAAELIEKLSRQLIEGQRLAEDLKRDARDPNQANGSITARAAYMVAQLQRETQRAESPRAEVNREPMQAAPKIYVERTQSPDPSAGFSTLGMMAVTDLIRLHILGYIDVLEADKQLSKDASKDADLIDKLKRVVNVGRSDGALNEMMRILSTMLSHSKADSDCSLKYKKLKDSVLANCRSYFDAADTKANVSADVDQATQKSIDKVTFALVRSDPIKKYLGEEKFGCLINVIRGCKSEDDIDEKMFMVGRVFPKINHQIGNVVRDNLELYRVETLMPPAPPVKATSSPSTLFPATRTDTPYPVRKAESENNKKRPDRTPPPTPSMGKKGEDN